MSETHNLIKARYDELCAIRDKTNGKVAGLQSKLTAANDRVNEAQAEANALALQISEVRGGANWLALKKEIGVLATALTASRKAGN
jgi:hypothetical protein